MASVEDKKRIIENNITKLDKDISDTLEKRVFHIAEKFENSIIEETNEERISFDNSFIETNQKSYCIDENKKYISGVYSSIDLYDKLLMAEIYGKDNTPTLIKSSEESENSTVAYLKNPLTDIAYSSFSKVLHSARVSYEESFLSVCEAVYYNKVPYCILPIENYEDGRLTGFINMIRKYELKIVLTCNVESANGKITKFALLKRELTKIECKKGISDGEYLEIGFSFGEQSKLHTILLAANFFGFNLNKVDSLPVYYSEKEYYYDVVFSGNGELNKFLYWLDFEFPRYEILGLYTSIKTL